MAVYPSNKPLFNLKLCKDAFQRMFNIAFFDAEKTVSGVFVEQSFYCVFTRFLSRSTKNLNNLGIRTLSHEK